MKKVVICEIVYVNILVKQYGHKILNGIRMAEIKIYRSIK